MPGKTDPAAAARALPGSPCRWRRGKGERGVVEWRRLGFRLGRPCGGRRETDEAFFFFLLDRFQIHTPFIHFQRDASQWI
jgi:hypothetical protein